MKRVPEWFPYGSNRWKEIEPLFDDNGNLVDEHNVTKLNPTEIHFYEQEKFLQKYKTLISETNQHTRCASVKPMHAEDIMLLTLAIYMAMVLLGPFILNFILS